MADDRKRVQLLKVVGTSLDHCYALVNVEQEIEEWLARICEWEGSRWRCIYRDDTDSATDCVLMPDGALLVARMDGQLVILGDGEPKIRNTNQDGGFLLGPLSQTEAILAGSRLSVLDLQGELEADLSTILLHCAGISVGSEYVFVVGGKGEFGELTVRHRTLRLRKLGSGQHLCAVTQHGDRAVVVGGWHGFVERRGDEGEWEDISLPQDRPIIGLAIRDTTLLACCGGVYAFDEESRTWHCEIEPVEEVWHLSSVDGHLLACHTYSGLISAWDGGDWRATFPPVATARDLR